MSRNDIHDDIRDENFTTLPFGIALPICRHVGILVLGSGAAGLNAALQLKRHGVDDLLLVTDGLDRGTSINTGSDKQTYYKLGLYGDEPDSPRKMAGTLFDGGAMHGDTALVEAALSARAFYNLLELGVPFPRDAFGQFPGYKTDHDPLQRATSIGPYTSRAMCRRLIDAVRSIGVPLLENRLAVRLFREERPEGPTVVGAACINLAAPLRDCLELYRCDHLVLALGGPGGFYRESVYPEKHVGGIGLALEIGAAAQNLAESQFGLASTAFRWNVSGTYMQALPRFISTDAERLESTNRVDGEEFLRPYFDSTDSMLGAVFLKGYQWPFDVRKIRGSSLIDLLVFREIHERGRRVFLDYRTNTSGLDFGTLPTEARDYLVRSGAAFGTPLDRLGKMNAPAVALYAEHGIDLAAQPLEIALCAQHNNGGLAVDCSWESVNIRNLFVAGELAGTHGVARPGGSALNSGQVAGFRIAERISEHIAQRISSRNSEQTPERPADDPDAFLAGLHETLESLPKNWRRAREELRDRMSSAAGPLVDRLSLERAAVEAWERYEDLHSSSGRMTISDPLDLAEALRTRSMVLAHAAYIESIRFFVVERQTGSRGSRLLLDSEGEEIHPALESHYRFVPEDPSRREFVQMSFPRIETGSHAEKATNGSDTSKPCGSRDCPSRLATLRCEEVPRRPIPVCDAWFETVWADHRRGEQTDS